MKRVNSTMCYSLSEGFSASVSLQRYLSAAIAVAAFVMCCLISNRASALCFVDTDCNDLNLCTIDVCAGGTCIYIPVPCNDGDACNGKETCNRATGLCTTGEP